MPRRKEMNVMGNKVAAYIRIDAGKDNEPGRKVQADGLEAYAARHGLEIVGYYEDIGVSYRVKITERPALQRMVEDAKAGKFDCILFTTLDRFIRTAAEYKALMEQNPNLVWQATEEPYSIATENDRVMFRYQMKLMEDGKILQKERAKALIKFLDHNREERAKRKAEKADDIKALRQMSGMTQKAFAEYFSIPRRTLEDWEGEKRQCPEYLVDLIEYKLKKENIIKAGE